MIRSRSSQNPSFYDRFASERPQSRLDFNSPPRSMSTKSARSNTTNPSPGGLVKSWEAFDKLFDDAFAPTAPPAAQDDNADSLYGSQYTYRQPTPRRNRPRTTYSTGDNASQAGFTQMYEAELEGAQTIPDETPFPGTYPLPDVGGGSGYGRGSEPSMYRAAPPPIQTTRPNRGPPADEPPSSADEDFQKMWEEAIANKKKRMTRTVTRRRILQHGMMSPGGTVSTNEPEKALKKKRSRFAPFQHHIPLHGPFLMCSALFP